MIAALLLVAFVGDPSPAPAPDLRAQLTSIAPNAFRARVEIVRRMIESEPIGPAISELDRILRLAPDEKHVLALLDEPATCAALAQSIAQEMTAPVGETKRSALLRAGARASVHGASPLKREIVVRALAIDARQAPATLEKTVSGSTAAQSSAHGTSSASDPLLIDLTRELSVGVTTRRAFACFALRRLAPGRALGELAVRGVFDSSLDVRDEAIFALRDARDPAACGAVVRALAGPSGKMRARAAEALGRMGYREAVEPLIAVLLAAAPAPSGGGSGGPVRANFYSGLSTAYVKDYDLEIAQGASVANPIVEMLTSGVVFDVGVAGTSSIPVAIEAWDTALALTRLTGQRFGTNGSEWQKWWREHRDEYLPPARSAPSTGGN